MITELTKEQIDKIQQYVDEYLKIGLSTTQMTQKQAEEDFLLIQKEILQKNPAPVLLVQSITELMKETK